MTPASQHGEVKRAVAVANLDHSFADALVRVLLAECDAIDGEHDVAAHDHLLTSDDRGQIAAAQAEAFRGRAVRDALHEQPGMR